MRGIVGRDLVIAAALVLTACSPSGTATPGLDGRPDAQTAGSAVGNDSDSEPPAAGSAATPTDNPGDPGDPGGTSSDTVPDTSVGAVPETTSDDATLSDVDSICGSLTIDGYETRKRTLDLIGSVRADVEASCPDALTALNDAVEIEERVTAFSVDDPPLTATDLTCSGTDFSLLITSLSDFPIGIHASLRLNSPGVDTPFGSTTEPLVVWSLEPGASTTLEGTFEATRPTDGPLECEVEIRPFDASLTEADASLGDAVVPQLAVDDPALWLPYLVAQAAAVIGVGNPDLAALIEDVRSSDYSAVVEAVGSTDATAPEVGVISVCSASITGPDDRRLSVVYFEELEASSHLRHAVFRRGNDNQWRWLSSSMYFDSKNYWDCGTPSINL